MIDFCNIGQIDNNTSKWGGKAVALSVLKKHGFHIPKGFVISSDAYRAYISDNLDLDDFRRALVHMCRATFKSNNHVELIFRSSANIENTDFISCPGVFDSVVQNPNVELLDNVRAVWKSTTSTRATAFYRLMNIVPESVSMAVLVQQRHIEHFSAVIHTSDLISNKKRIVLEYMDGHAASVVDGWKNANTVYLQTTDDSPTDIPKEIISQIITDCGHIESVFGYPVELEAQIGTNTICYLQARKLL